MNSVSDRALFDCARTGDHAAFGTLIRRLRHRIVRVLVHMLRDQTLAEDLAQETFTRGYRALQSFDGRSEPYTWFYRIAINLGLNAIRSQKVSRGRALACDPRLEQLPHSADPSELAIRKEGYLALCAGLDALSEALRVTLVLVCVDGRTHAEVAAILAIPEGTVAWRVHEARRKLRETLMERGFDPSGLSAPARSPSLRAGVHDHAHAHAHDQAHDPSSDDKHGEER
jgi:RNA polymerase sigma-70 factor, ECF subfamily